MFKHEEQPEPMNHEAEAIVKANSFASQIFAKPGVLVAGEKGLEFRAESGVGFIQMPWSAITLVRVDIYKKYVRSIEVQTDTTVPLSFTVSDAAPLLRAIRDHIGRDKMGTVNHAFEGVIQRHKDKRKAKQDESAPVPNDEQKDGGAPGTQDGPASASQDDGVTKDVD